MRPSRRDLLKAGLLAAIPLPAAARAQQRQPSRHLWGVNLAGADFGALPGTHGTEYLYPPPENIDYYARLGFQLVRIPFKWERLQPRADAPFAEQELSLLQGVVRHARRRGLTVVLDPHNYARRRLAADGWSQEHMIGSREVPIASFADFWRRLAERFKDDDGILFGLMNEPAGIEPEPWLEAANAAIAQIRAAGADNLLLVPGVAYTGAHSWHSAGNEIMAKTVDPLDRYAFEVHQYLDADSSGTRPNAVSATIGSERIAAFQEWARSLGKRAFLGEYSAGRDDLSIRALMDLCDEMAANPDVWMGSAAWAGGPRWPPDDMFNLEPEQGGEIRRQTDVIRSRAAADAERRFWSEPLPSLYADFARKLTPGAPEMAAALRELTGLPEFTLLVETRNLAGDTPLLGCGGIRLLSANGKGRAGSELAGGLTASASRPGSTREKLRYAISIRRQSGEVALAATGGQGVSGRGAGPFAAAATSQDIRISETADGAAAAGITRIIGFSQFMTPEALAKAVA